MPDTKYTPDERSTELQKIMEGEPMRGIAGVPFDPTPFEIQLMNFIGEDSKRIQALQKERDVANALLRRISDTSLFHRTDIQKELDEILGD
jgi:hypothetical protein